MLLIRWMDGEGQGQRKFQLLVAPVSPPAGWAHSERQSIPDSASYRSDGWEWPLGPSRGH